MNNTAAIKHELMEKGPMESAFEVYEDFYNYKSGVYSHVDGDYVAGHSVKVVGWGK